MDQQVKQEFDKITKEGKAQYRAGKITGHEISLNEMVFQTVGTAPLTQQQYDGILKGTMRIYILSWYAWTDSQSPLGHKTFGDDCRCLLPPEGGATFNQTILIWRWCQ
jgi:hypothetical protein